MEKDSISSNSGISNVENNSPRESPTLKMFRNEVMNEKKRFLSGKTELGSPTGFFEKEIDTSIISRREKQIEYGKGTPEYLNYAGSVPRGDREPFHPKTPNKYRKYSRRAWDGLIKKWRRELHAFSDLPIIDNDMKFTDIEPVNLNLSFSSETSSAFSSSTNASSPNKIKANNTNKRVKRQLMMKEDKYDGDDDDDEEEEDIDADSEGFQEMKPSIKLENTNLKREYLSTSWADDVEEDEDYWSNSTSKNSSVISVSNNNNSNSNKKIKIEQFV